ncbi:MAG: DUF1844 domain-containing protein [Bdellovibrionaceae bacterium]|nr:DUF1844 domain-containing protein [Pseudobdellovibrionaceae bacterium]
MSEKNLQASFSALVMSIASSAAVSLGLAPNPATGKVEKDKRMAQFSIDLLVILEQKTKGNLSDEERQLLSGVLADLQMKFLQMKEI